MTAEFNTMTMPAGLLENFKGLKSGEVDLSGLNLFDTAKMITIISTYFLRTNQQKKIRCRVSVPNIENILKDIPMHNLVEFV